MTQNPRRQFLAQTAALATLPLISSLGSAQASGKKLGVALCGLGSLSTNQIAPALQKTRNCRLAGIVTGTPSKAEEWKKKYGLSDKSVYNYDTMSQMASNPDIDIVYVVTPNALHMDHTLAAAAAGKHVFCEKPLEISVQRAQRMVDACKKAGRCLAWATARSSTLTTSECVRLAKGEGAGRREVHRCELRLRDRRPKQWRLNRALAGGGSLMDVGIYCLQTTRMLTGEDPIWISATEVKTDAVKFKEVDETVLWQSKFRAAWWRTARPPTRRTGSPGFRAATSRGWFSMEPAYFYNGNRGRRSDGTEINTPVADQFVLELEDLPTASSTSGRPRCRARWGWRT
jgi:predicted dehydrogenase